MYGRFDELSEMWMVCFEEVAFFVTITLQHFITRYDYGLDLEFCIGCMHTQTRGDIKKCSTHLNNSMHRISSTKWVMVYNFQEHSKRLAVAMALHKRVGGESYLHHLDPHVLKLILDQVTTETDGYNIPHLRTYTSKHAVALSHAHTCLRTQTKSPTHMQSTQSRSLTHKHV